MNAKLSFFHYFHLAKLKKYLKANKAEQFLFLLFIKQSYQGYIRFSIKTTLHHIGKVKKFNVTCIGH